MSYRTDEFIFDPAEKARLEDSLRSIDVFLSGLAKLYRLRLLPHASKGWPGRTLFRRKWFKTYSLRISLEPPYENAASPINWEIHDVWMFDAGEFGRKTLAFRNLAKNVGKDRMDSQSTHDLIRNAIEQNLAGSSR